MSTGTAQQSKQLAGSHYNTNTDVYSATSVSGGNQKSSNLKDEARNPATNK